jgi:predicted permease
VKPPRLAEALLGLLLPRSGRDEVLGDLAESYGSRAEGGRVRAMLWYSSQVPLVPAWFLVSAVASVRFDAAELRRTIRTLARTPGFTTVAVLSLGLGIGATTAISGALYSLLFVTLPVDRPDEITMVYHTWPERWQRSQYGSSSSEDPRDGARVASNVSWPAFETLKRTVSDDIGLSAYAFVREMSVVFADAPALAVGGMLVSGDYFRTLKLETEIGRPLNEADDRVGSAPVVVLSHSFWSRTFGGDRSVLGSTVLLNGAAFEIVGVAKKGYVGLSPGGFFGPSDVIVPITWHDTFVSIRLRDDETLRTAGQTHWIRLIARVPRGLDSDAISRGWTATLAAHMVEAGVIAEADAGHMQLRFLEGKRGLDSLRRDTRRPLWILSAAVVLVLLIACANLTTLLLARGAVRTQELALRRAIGASRWELARPQVVESLLLGVTGGALGLLIALHGGPLIVASLTGGAGAAAVEYQMSWPLVLAAAVGALVAAALTGCIPAVRMMRTEPAENLGTRSQGGVAHRFRLGRALIIAQIAVSVPLVVGAGLFLETLGNIVAIDPGFDPDGVVVFRVDATLVTRNRDEQRMMYERILAQLGETPGVRSAAIAENIPVSGWQSNTRVEVGGERPMMDMNAVSPAFFETMRIRLLSGRRLTETDAANAPDVVLVNQTAERTLFDGNALGRDFRISGGRRVEIVGVVSDIKYSGLKDAVEPAFFDPWVQRPGGLFSVHYAVRTDGAPLALAPTIRRLVAGVNSGLPVIALRSQRDEIASQAERERVFARLLTAFGAFAVLLSCIGLHGLMSFSVSQRTSEMGVRLALGAAPASIVTMIMRQVLMLTGLGLGLGILVSLQVGPVVRSMLFDIEPDDRATILLAAAIMACVALLAGSIPALRASRVDPLESLSP